MIVFTCITNNYDPLLDPIDPQENTTYLCFTDNKELKSDIWETRPLLASFDNPIITARYHKILGPFSLEKDYSMWQDAKLLFEQRFPTNWIGEDLCLIKHPIRDCVYDEAVAVIELGKANWRSTNLLISKYQANNYPAKNGLFETCVVMRKHTQKNFELSKLWFEDVQKCHRDQISLPYLLWKTGIKPRVLDIYKKHPNDPFVNDYFDTTHHHSPPPMIPLL